MISGNKKVLVTGAAGFIGFHLTKKLADAGVNVVGLDNINSYYDTDLKYDRLAELGIDRSNIKWNTMVLSKSRENCRFIQLDLEDRQELLALFAAEQFTYVVNLAAQAGVRYSIENPYAYAGSNLVGFLNILEGCRHSKVTHLVYASSSSVYGLNTSFPSVETDPTQHPGSFYAATKMANELMAHSYSHLYNLPATGLRFFTVYGPWGRPDMAFFLFTKAILENKPIKVFNSGHHQRDFTYIDDIVEGIINCIDKPAQPLLNWDKADKNIGTSSAPYRVYNIGSSSTVNLLTYIETIEEVIGKKAEKDFQAMQPGDLLVTHADISALRNDFNYHPKTSIREGIRKFVDWFVTYYHYR
jgi:UDP-glucuronate 4-epimerase